MAGYSPANEPLKLPFYFLSLLNGEGVKKLWGWEYWIVNNDKYCFKVLTIDPGFQCSLHFHNIKDETFVVYQGTILLETCDAQRSVYERVLNAGSKQHIPPKTPHRFRALNAPATVFEISTHHDDADVVRIVDSQTIPEIPRCIA